MVTPIEMPSKNFKTYKDKVIFILNKFDENLDYPQELNWCLHVIKNDFLQISNSMLSNQPGTRRFSKTQRIINYEDCIESGILNNWVTVLLN